MKVDFACLPIRGCLCGAAFATGKSTADLALVLESGRGRGHHLRTGSSRSLARSACHCYLDYGCQASRHCRLRNSQTSLHSG